MSQVKLQEIETKDDDEEMALIKNEVSGSDVDMSDDETSEE